MQTKPKTLGEMLAEDKASGVVVSGWHTWVSSWLQLNDIEDHTPLRIEAVGLAACGADHKGAIQACLSRDGRIGQIITGQRIALIDDGVKGNTQTIECHKHSDDWGKEDADG